MKTLGKKLTLMQVMAAALFILSAAVSTALSSDSLSQAALPELGTLPVATEIHSIEKLNVFYDQALLIQTLKLSLVNRQAEGITHALETLKLPGRDKSGRLISGRAEAHFVARNILQAFPTAAGGRLVAAYASGDTMTRANLITVAGALPGKEITVLLSKALTDTTRYEDLDPERPGDPLRLCDLAYNQLVLRLKTPGVLRTIGPGLRYGTRDFHIAVLKGKL